MYSKHPGIKLVWAVLRIENFPSLKGREGQRNGQKWKNHTCKACRKKNHQSARWSFLIKPCYFWVQTIFLGKKNSFAFLKIQICVVVVAQASYSLAYPTDLKRKTASSFFCFIFEAKKFTAAILVRPLCCETPVCKSIDKISMTRIVQRIFW